jgi:hypothetical protein
MQQPPGKLKRTIMRLFGTLTGLLILVVAWDALIVASLSLFSGPVL